MKRKAKCYAVPKGWVIRGTDRKICDGCVTNSTKCPFRNKTRDSRIKERAKWKREMINSIKE